MPAKIATPLDEGEGITSGKVAYIAVRLQALESSIQELDLRTDLRVKMETALREAADATAQLMMTQREQSDRTAIQKQEKAEEYARAQSNEWRGSLTDLSEKMATKTDLGALDDRVAKAERALLALPDRLAIDTRFHESSDARGILEKRLSALELGGATSEGGREQRTQSRASLIAIMTVVAAAAGGVVSLIVHNLFPK